MSKISIFKLLKERDDNKLALKPISARLPIHVMARLNAMGDMFPDRTRSQILIELLKAGIDSFEGDLTKGFTVSDRDMAMEWMEDVGTYIRGQYDDFERLTEKHVVELESELQAAKPAKDSK